jgi:endoglucanase
MRRLNSRLPLILALAMPTLSLVGCGVGGRNPSTGNAAPQRDGDDAADDDTESLGTDFGAPVTSLLVDGSGAPATVDNDEAAFEDEDDLEEIEEVEQLDEEEEAEEVAEAEEAEEAEEVVEEPETDSTLAAWSLYVEPESHATRQADSWRDSDPEGAAHMDRMGDEPLAVWVGDWMSDVAGSVDDTITAGGDQLRTLVVYNIPNRDCGAWSAGGASSAAAYAAFIDEVARGLDNRSALVILEPDGLAVTSCLSASQITERHAMMAAAVETLSNAGAQVYIDAGQAGWIDDVDMASRLSAAGVANAAGFALNVAHTHSTEDNVGYAEELRAVLGPDAHYVVDTGRNGLGPDADAEWCNPLGRAVGESPTLSTGVTGLDALLWVKAPGESDGECNGGPEAGAWWADYARGLVERGET